MPEPSRAAEISLPTDRTQIVRGALICPMPDNSVVVHADGALACDASGKLTFAGAWQELARQLGSGTPPIRNATGVILPPMLDAHIHIPQFPIRGKFTEGVPDDAPHGRLLAGLERNVFPAESRCADAGYTEQLVRDFLEGTLSRGVVGGAAYMTVHTEAARIALSILPASWHVGLVLMNQNCPAQLRTDETNLERDIESLAREFGRRLIVTDRFAVATDTPLRSRAARLARRLGLRTQTHLNEQLQEKQFVEQTLYRSASSYTHVYARDGLLSPGCILAHCIHMREAEWETVASSGSVVAHCPTSNTLLGSGIMLLDTLARHGVDYAICTDIGASPTPSLLAEAAQFCIVHAGRSVRATAQEAIARVTVAPARLLGMHDTPGTFEPGRPMSYVEMDAAPCDVTNADDLARNGVLRLSSFVHPTRDDLDALASGAPSLDVQLRLRNAFDSIANALDGVVQRVVLKGATVWQRTGA